MLPDYPELRRQILARLAYQVQSIVNGDPVLSQIATTRMHEGRRAGLIREDRTTHEFDFNNPASATAEFSVDEIRKSGIAAADRAVRRIGETMKEVIARRTFAELERATEEVGNALDAMHQPLTPDMVLQMLDRMEHSFDDDGTWHPPSLVIHPDMARRTDAVLRELSDNPELRARHDALVDRKREEWHVREARRKLVD